MTEFGSKTASNAKLRVALGLVFVAALLIRGMALMHAYPAPEEVTHVVQMAREHGAGNRVPFDFSLPVGSQCIGIAAEKIGLPSERVLQVLALLTGSLLCVAAALWLWRSTHRIFPVLFAGGVAAANPLLIYYSTTGFSEMPFALCLMVSAMACYDWMSGRAPGNVRLLLAFAVLGVAAYFRTDESLVLAGLGLAAVAAKCLIRRGWKTSGQGLGAAAVFLLMLVPLCLIFQRETGSYVPRVKSYGFAIGQDFYDSKQFYQVEPRWSRDLAEVDDKGTVRYVWDHKAQIWLRWMHNAVRLVRLSNDYIFPGTFRMGAGWFVLALGTCLAANIRWARGRQWVVAVAIWVCHLSLVALFMAAPRYVSTSIVFALILLCGGVDAGLQRAPFVGCRGRTVLALLLLAFVMSNALFGIRGVLEKSRPFLHAQAVGEKLRSYGNENDILMTKQYWIALHFYDEHPQRLVRMPYGSMEQVEKFAEDHGVTLIALTDSVYGHWPVCDVFRGKEPPPNWTLLEDVVFEEKTRFGLEVEKYKLYRRSPEQAAKPWSSAAKSCRREAAAWTSHN